MSSAHGYGYDATNLTWRKLAVDANGRQLMSPEGLFEGVPTDGETNKGPTSNWAYDHENDASAHHAKYTDAEARTAVSAGLTLKIVNIGDWDMDGTITVTVAHGLTLSTIRRVEVLIRDDADGAYYDPSYSPADGSAGGGYGITYVDSTNVRLSRVTGGPFDATSFNATSFNRGWILIWYVA